MNKEEVQKQKKFEWSKVGAIAGVCSFVLAVFILVLYTSPDHTNQLGGLMNVTYYSRLLNNKDSKTIVVCW